MLCTDILSVILLDRIPIIISISNPCHNIYLLYSGNVMPPYIPISEYANTMRALDKRKTDTHTHTRQGIPSSVQHTCDHIFDVDMFSYI